jgi:soluble lytic murein transglycosylase
VLDRFGGDLIHTLAGYNAGESRVDQWVLRENFEEPAEFVESIPFTETRGYVQSVLRNAEVYRRLYGGENTGSERSAE